MSSYFSECKIATCILDLGPSEKEAHDDRSLPTSMKEQEASQRLHCLIYESALNLTKSKRKTRDSGCPLDVLPLVLTLGLSPLSLLLFSSLSPQNIMVYFLKMESPEA